METDAVLGYKISLPWARQLGQRQRDLVADHGVGFHQRQEIVAEEHGQLAGVEGAYLGAAR